MARRPSDRLAARSGSSYRPLARRRGTWLQLDLVPRRSRAPPPRGAIRPPYISKPWLGPTRNSSRSPPGASAAANLLRLGRVMAFHPSFVELLPRVLEARGAVTEPSLVVAVSTSSPMRLSSCSTSEQNLPASSKVRLDQVRRAVRETGKIRIAADVVERLIRTKRVSRTGAGRWALAYLRVSTRLFRNPTACPRPVKRLWAKTTLHPESRVKLGQSPDCDSIPGDHGIGGYPHRDRCARGRMLLGHGGGVRACEGRYDVVSGYAGSAGDANYEAVASERTKHAEAVRITYDPRRLLRSAAPGLLRGRPRPYPGEPPGPRRGSQLPFGDLPPVSRASAIRFSDASSG